MSRMCTRTSGKRGYKLYRPYDYGHRRYHTLDDSGDTCRDPFSAENPSVARVGKATRSSTAERFNTRQQHIGTSTHTGNPRADNALAESAGNQSERQQPDSSKFTCPESTMQGSNEPIRSTFESTCSGPNQVGTADRLDTSEQFGFGKGVSKVERARNKKLIRKGNQLGDKHSDNKQLTVNKKFSREDEKNRNSDTSIESEKSPKKRRKSPRPKPVSRMGSHTSGKNGYSIYKK